ncbi:MAG: NAD(P)H-hydrate dehydratase, partial [Deltaproteobacteria bacterium]|nr:NAD(P)H-hydrate dehydratase [Deltaproteobacteria bacterium]
LNAGCNVRAVLLANVDEVRGDARINLDAFQNMGGLVREVADEVRWKELAAAMSHAGLVVDALLGTGLSSDVRDLYRRVIQDINSLESLVVVSVDIPSGIDATTGRVLEVAVKADLTCTYGLAKRGQHFYPGAEHVGRLEVIDIGIPRRLVDMAGITEHVQEASDFAGMLPPRAADSHKGTYGHAGIIAGSPGKTGAAALAARAAMRIGAGLVTLGVPGSLNAVLEQKVTEVMTEPLPDEDGFLGHAAQDCVRNLLAGKKVIALGPGLAIRNHTCDFMCRIVEQAEVPLVIDADGLNALALRPETFERISVPVILTPHPGEMARLLDTTVTAVQGDRPGAVRRCAQQSGAIVVLKGARSLIAAPDGELWINPTGNPGMASGGMGDVLTGMITGLIAQGLAPLSAVRFAVYLHGDIGDRLAETCGRVGMLATDMIEQIPAALDRYV